MCIQITGLPEEQATWNQFLSTLLESGTAPSSASYRPAVGFIRTEVSVETSHGFLGSGQLGSMCLVTGISHNSRKELMARSRMLGAHWHASVHDCPIRKKGSRTARSSHWQAHQSASSVTNIYCTKVYSSNDSPRILCRIYCWQRLQSTCTLPVVP